MNQHSGGNPPTKTGEISEHLPKPRAIGRRDMASISHKRQIKQHRSEVTKHASLNQAAMHIAREKHPLPWSDHGQ